MKRSWQMKARLVLALVGMVGLFLNVEPATAGGGENENACKSGCKGPYPDGYNGFLVFMATGSLPVTLFIHGIVNAGMITIIVARPRAATRIWTMGATLALYRTTVSTVAMNSMW